MGKAANYVLRDLPNVVSVSIHAPFADCVQAIMARTGMTQEDAGKAVRRTDKYRAAYHRYYTGVHWKDPIQYDLCLNSARVGRENCAEIIKKCVSRKLGISLPKVPKG